MDDEEGLVDVINGNTLIFAQDDMYTCPAGSRPVGPLLMQALVCSPDLSKQEPRLSHQPPGTRVVHCKNKGKSAHFALRTTIPSGNPIRKSDMLGMGFAYKPIWTVCPGAGSYPQGARFARIRASVSCSDLVARGGALSTRGEKDQREKMGVAERSERIGSPRSGRKGVEKKGNTGLTRKGVERCYVAARGR